MAGDKATSEASFLGRLFGSGPQKDLGVYVPKKAASQEPPKKFRSARYVAPVVPAGTDAED